MGFSLSAAVSLKETDLTNTVPAVSTSIGALVGDFEWGPVKERTQIDGENNLVKKFGLPNETNYEDWFSASNFLSYANNLELVRVVGSAAVNSGDIAGILVENLTFFDANISTIEASTNNFVGKYPGVFGNKIIVSVADAASYSGWTYENDFDYAPTGNEFWMIVLYDGNIVEKFYLNRDVGSKDFNGNSNYAPEMVNRTSTYVYMVAANLITYIGQTPDAIGGDYTLILGLDDAPIDADRQVGYDLFANPDEVDVNLLMQAGGSKVVGLYIKDNVADVRKDLVAFLSPEKNDVVGALDPVTTTIVTRNSYGSSSYCIMDNNWKYQYDKYNDKYRWIPLNADIAGTCAYTDDVRDPWASPGGPDRGQIKNVIKLAYNPTKAQRDKLYQSAINPVVTFPGQGTMLYGDKTLQAKPSAFDRINVRRLFIVLEKAIATAAKFSLFEYNDTITRTRFVNMVEPYLRNIQGRRGIIDFRVVADDTNNTDIGLNDFVGDIYIKPTPAINFIYLNFVAVGPNVTFEELIAA